MFTAHILPCFILDIMAVSRSLLNAKLLAGLLLFYLDQSHLSTDKHYFQYCNVLIALFRLNGRIQQTCLGNCLM